MERFKGACTDWTSYAEINRKLLEPPLGVQPFQLVIAARRPVACASAVFRGAPGMQRSVEPGASVGHQRSAMSPELPLSEQLTFQWAQHKFSSRSVFPIGFIIHCLIRGLSRSENP